MKPHDALQLELEGISSGAGEEVRDLLAVAEGLRSAASQIGTPPGLQARRGAILASVAPADAIPARRARLPRVLAFAGALVAAAAIGWVGGLASDGFFDRFGGPAPAADPTPLPTPDEKSLESETPRPEPTPSPSASESAEPSSSPVATGLEKPDPDPTVEPSDSLEPGETPDLDGDNSGPGSDSSGSGSDGDSSGSGSDGDSSGSGSDGSGSDSP